MSKVKNSPNEKKAKENIQRLHIRLHPEKDADIINHLCIQKHKSDFVKKLIREHMWKEEKGLKFVPVSEVEQRQAIESIEVQKERMLDLDEEFEVPEENTENSAFDFFDS
ncbi:hypothetical protein CN918_31650 [Priestia megaterium]|nr:hypothetical protein CN918_31650 [Priestia megaterium]